MSKKRAKLIFLTSLSIYFFICLGWAQAYHKNSRNSMKTKCSATFGIKFQKSAIKKCCFETESWAAFFLSLVGTNDLGKYIDLVLTTCQYISVKCISRKPNFVEMSHEASTLGMTENWEVQQFRKKLTRLIFVSSFYGCKMNVALEVLTDIIWPFFRTSHFRIFKSLMCKRISKVRKGTYLDTPLEINHVERT